MFPVDASDVGGKVEHNRLHVRHSTFLGGLVNPAHRWFRLTPSFGPELVDQALDEMDASSDAVVLDPFAGTGTTLIQSKLNGLRTVGFEINPLLHFVCETTLNWHLDANTLKTTLQSIEDNFSIRRNSAGNLSLPAIHNVERWWRADVLRDLVVLLDTIETVHPDRAVVNFFRLALVGVLVPDLTNVTLGRLQLHFIDRSSDHISVLDTFHRHAQLMIDDVSVIADLQSSEAQVFHRDSTDPGQLDRWTPATHVITSPPYPNRYSYVWNTRPHLYLLGLFKNARQAGELDLKTIGGTWGTATSSLLKGTVKPLFPAVEQVVGPAVRQIRERDNLMANYVMKYFNLLAKQVVSQDKLLAPSAKLAYVVGCSWIKDVYLETDVLLGRIVEGLDLNYGVSKIVRFRRRHSGKDLHEAVVYLAKN